MPTLDELLQNPLAFWVGIGALILVILIFRRARKMPYVAQDTLLTPSELKFYNVLKMAMPNHLSIMMKVRMGDIITCSDADWRAGWGPRISAKHIDFVLIDRHTTKIILGIELDDRTHQTNKDRIERDKFVNKAFEVARVPLLRVPTSGYYKVDELRKSIDQLIAQDQRRI